jgi:hypothetical protein
MEGLRTRRSFIDVMRSRGVPGAVAVPLGLAGDILLDPGAIMTGGLSKALTAGRMAKLVKAAASVPDAVRSADDVARGVGDLAHWDKMADQATLLRHGRRVASRDAYQIAKETGGPIAALRAARQAAKDYNPSPEDLAQLGESILSSTKFGPPSASLGGSWQRSVNYLKNRLFFATEDYVRSASDEFGSVGPEFVHHGKKQEATKQALVAETGYHKDLILKLVSRNKEDYLQFTRAVHGLISPGELSPRLFKALEKWGELSGVRLGDLQRHGVKQIHTALTIAFARKSPEAQQAIMALLKGEGTSPAAEYAAGSAEWFAQKVRGLGADITVDGAVHMPIRAHANYGPIYIKADAIKGRRTQMDFQRTVSGLMEAEPGLSLAMARELAEKKAMEIFMAPNDVRRQFQFGRLGENISGDEKSMEMNPHIWMTKWANDVSDRISQAMVWGGEDQVFKGMKESLQLQGDRVPGFKGHERLQHIFDLMTGQNPHPLKPLVGAVGQAANVSYLGPRTTILQATQLANSMGWSGIVNTFAGIVEALFNPDMRKLVNRLGVSMPNIFHSADEGQLHKVVSFWHKAMGIETADKAVRVSSAIAGGLRGIETAENLWRATRIGNQAAAAKYAKELQLHGIDVGKVLARKGELVFEEMNAYMLRSANASNFTNSVMSLPSVFKEPGGQFFLKFKNYAVQQSGFIHKLTQRAKNGDWAPLLRYAAMFPWTYGMVFKAMNSLRARPIDTEDDWAMLQNMLMTGALGFWGDSALALGSPSEAIRLGVFAGPNANLVGRLGSAVVKGVTGDLEGLEAPWRGIAGLRQLETAWTGEQE